MKKKSARELKFISLEERVQPRLRYVGIDLELLSGDRFIVRVELETRPGSTIIGTVEGNGSGMERLRCSALATVKAMRTAIGVEQDQLQFLDLGTVRVFETPAIVVSLAAHAEGELQLLVGFCVAEEELPVRAAVLAVLNAANRFLGAVQVECGHFRWTKARKN